LSVPAKTRVLVVDDSAIVRRVLTDILAGEPDIEVVGTAPDPYIARDKIVALNPDVLTLDLEMPRMDGLTFLGKLMERRPLPVIVISSLGQASCDHALEALRRGAVEVLAKPGGPYSVGDLKTELPLRIRAAAAARPVRRDTENASAATTIAIAGKPRGRIVAIGASTGGTQAIETVIKALPAEMPPIVVAQHIPPVFSSAFARRLNSVCRLEVHEVQDDEPINGGTVYIAPGDQHFTVHATREGLRARLNRGTKVCYQRPSVDVLFRSVAAAVGADAVGVLLTGMGKDGAEGLLEMKQRGAFTLAQDESTCVIFGMPGEAVRLNAADKVAPLPRIPSYLVSHAA
jgi:two-component system, chemotaxis family, protein-glutamate methylesterase/glutaminase